MFKCGRAARKAFASPSCKMCLIVHNTSMVCDDEQMELGEAGGEGNLVVLLQVGLQGGDAGGVNVQHSICAVHWRTECLIAGQHLYKGPSPCTQ